MHASQPDTLLKSLISLSLILLLLGCEAPPESVSQQVKKQPPGSIAALVRRVNPAVVNIQAVRSFGFAPQAGPELWGSPTPRQASQGSGFLIDPQGYLATNSHLVHGAQKLVVTSWQGQKVGARLLGEDRQTDLALLKLTAPLAEVSYLEFGDSENLAVGERVLALGNPFGLENTVTMGIVSGKGRSLGAGLYDDFLQTDASINPGNSGGPLVNLQGEVVGINTAMLAQGQGIGFAIPSSLARPVLNQLKQYGRIVRGFLGVVVQPVTAPLAVSFGLKAPHGALVSDVIPNTAAARAGIRRGDIILEFDGQRIDQMPELPRRAALTPVGKKVSLKIFRDGREFALSLCIGEMPRSLAERGTLSK